jgi:prophage DNA circulation protein
VVSIDQGRRARRFHLSVFFLGDDVEAQAKSLITALEQPGPGLLVHPYLGRVMVIPSADISVHTTVARLRKVEISFDAIESVQPAPTQADGATAAKKSAALRAADRVRVDATKQFGASWDLTGVSEFVRAANLASVTNVMTNLAKVANTISALLSVPGTIAQELDRISLQIVTMYSTPALLVAALQHASAVVYAALDRVAGEVGEDVTLASGEATATAIPLTSRRESVVHAALTSDLTSGDDPISTRDTAMRTAQRANFAALRQSVYATAIADIASVASGVDWPSTADNTAIRDALMSALDDLLLDELVPDMVDSLEALRSATWSRFTRVGTTLTEYTPLTELPASVIAYELYGDAERADEIVDRNAIAHPSAVPGGVTLTVLSS